MEISDVTSSPNFVESSQTGFAALKAEDFMQMLITQLQYQDPLEPVGNDEILSQISQMQNLQSNIELSDALESFVAGQELSTAASYIGRSVIANDASGLPIEGIAEKAFLAEGQVYLEVNGVDVLLSSVTSINQP